MFPAKEKTLSDDDEDDDDDNFVDDDDDDDDEDDDVDNFVYDDNGKPSTTCFPATEKTLDKRILETDCWILRNHKGPIITQLSMNYIKSS